MACNVYRPNLVPVLAESSTLFLQSRSWRLPRHHVIHYKKLSSSSTLIYDWCMLRSIVYLVLHYMNSLLKPKQNGNNYTLGTICRRCNQYTINKSRPVGCTRKRRLNDTPVGTNLAKTTKDLDLLTTIYKFPHITSTGPPARHQHTSISLYSHRLALPIFYSGLACYQTTPFATLYK